MSVVDSMGRLANAGPPARVSAFLVPAHSRFPVFA